MRWWVLALVLGGCSSDPEVNDDQSANAAEDPVEQNPNNDDPGESCFTTVDSVNPPSGSVSVPLEVTVTVTFSEPVEEGGWSVAVPGVAGTSALGEDGLTATWSPNEPLDFLTQYTVEATVCGMTSNTLFTTVGEPIEPLDITGNTYEVEWGNLTFIEPPNGGSLLSGGVAFDSVLLQFVSIDAVTQVADMAATYAIDAYGSPIPECGSMVEEEGDFSGNPYFEFGPSDVVVPVTLDVDGNPVTTTTVEDLTLTAEVSSTGDKLINVTLYGLLATEDIPYSGGNCEDSAIVDLVQGTCETCTVSNSDKCLLVEATVSEALLQTAMDLVGLCP